MSTFSIVLSNSPKDIPTEETLATACSGTQSSFDSPVSSQRNEQSAIWEYCVPRIGGEPFRNSNGAKIWKCNVCVANNICTEFNIQNGNSAVSRHLQQKHRILLQDRIAKRQETVQKKVTRITELNEGMPPPNKRQKLGLDATILRELWLQFITQNNLPLRLHESPSLRKLLEYLNPEANAILSSSGKYFIAHGRRKLS
ncbi:hypothetical protein NEOLI_005149 [Neolecta irregularis DAH-3]|uniref:BED-type domain-containing protein n=1 Tax=Neolecta irregularis (strain DAH-3) TaxID=1198029 RepID=A0A1U7LIL2_NEOID|nr:hypothetical protein NEOLI_005149 [Neolecta irregularis DAH-3]|eukprot:OLL22484.1 hypothetical protein NEOLI_005149 [Neolecta irregularis DAH-3]